MVCAALYAGTTTLTTGSGSLDAREDRMVWDTLSPRENPPGPPAEPTPGRMRHAKRNRVCPRPALQLESRPLEHPHGAGDVGDEPLEEVAGAVDAGGGTTTVERRQPGIDLLGRHEL